MNEAMTMPRMSVARRSRARANFLLHLSCSSTITERRGSSSESGCLPATNDARDDATERRVQVDRLAAINAKPTLIEANSGQLAPFSAAFGFRSVVYSYVKRLAGKSVSELTRFVSTGT